MNRRCRATFPISDPRARTLSLFPPNPLHPDIRVNIHLPDLPPKRTLTGPLTDAHPHTHRDDIIPIQDPDYPDSHHSDQPRQLKHHPDPAVRPLPVLEEQHSASVSESHADFLAPLPTKLSSQPGSSLAFCPSTHNTTNPITSTSLRCAASASSTCAPNAAAIQ